MKTGILVGLAAPLLAAAPALAAEPQDEGAPAAQLEAVHVQGKSRSTRTEHRDSFTTSAMRTTTGLALSPKETPQSVSVITKTQLEGRGISSLEDALRTTTGVTVLRDSDRARFQSRGFYIDQIEEDGISSSISSFVGDTIHNAESLTDLALYDHIEVVRGATGLTQADGEPGGTVNAVRKRPTAERKLSGSLGFGRYDAYRAELDASGRLNAAGSIRGRFVAAGEKSGSFTQRVNSRQRLLYGVMDFDLTDSTTLTAGAMHQHRDAVPDVFGLPRGSVEHPLDLPRDSYSGAYWNDSRFSKLNFFTELRHQFDDNWRLTSTLDYRRDHALREYSALNSTQFWQNSNGSIFASGSRRADNDAKQIAFQNILTGSFQALGRSHDVFATYGYNRRRTESETMQHWDLWVDPNDPNNQFCAGMGWPRWCDPTLSRYFPLNPFNGGLIPRPQWDKLADLDYQYNPIHRRQEEKTVSHAVSAGIRFNPTDNLHILAGGRYTRWKYRLDAYDILHPTPRYLEDLAQNSKRSRFVPYLGITWDFTPQQSLYASYTAIFKPQLDKRGENGSYLPPVTGTNYEIGWKTALRQNRLNTAVALFWIDQKNRAVYSHDDDNGIAVYNNSGRVVSRGMDAEISGHLTDNWQLFAGYTFNASKHRNTDDEGEAGANYSRHTPRHIFRLYTRYRLPGAAAKWSIGGGLSSQSRTSDYYDQPHLRQGGYTLWNADIQYRPTPNIRLSLIGNNLFDKRYFENNANRSNGGYNFYGTPRTLTFKVNWQF